MAWIEQPSAAADPSSRGPPSHSQNANDGGVSSFHPPAKYVDSGSWFCWRMLTENPRADSMSWPILVCLPTQNRTSGGSSDSDVKEFAVIALIEPSMSA